MRKALLLGCVLSTGCIAYLVVSPSQSQQRHRRPEKPASTHISHQTALEEFLLSLDAASVRKCLQLRQNGHPIDRQTLLECGDFSLYAAHQSLPEQYAIGHFKNILKHSSSLESLRAQLHESALLIVPTASTP
jgi:hypothetical protein